jgi:hypothetical protein
MATIGVPKATWMKIGTMMTASIERRIVKAKAQIVHVILFLFTSGARCEGEGGVDSSALQGSQTI